jgi:hypothetical protein
MGPYDGDNTFYWKEILGDKSKKQGIQGILDMQKHSWVNLGTETEGDVLDIHHAVRPTVTYATTVWVQFKTSKVEHSKLQRRACLCVTEAIKTAPTPATEVIIGLQPLHLHLEAEARPGIYSLYCSNQRKPKFEGLDMHMTQDMKEGPNLQMMIDQRVPRHVHNKPFTIRTF